MRTLADTNFVLRYLLADHPVESARAHAFAKKSFAEGPGLAISEAVLAEALFMLVERMGVSRHHACEGLRAAFESGFAAWDPRVALRTLELYESVGRLDPVDAILLASAESRGDDIASFDKLVNRIAGDRAVF
jgi:predicted nucleic acid-binding protein